MKNNQYDPFADLAVIDLSQAGPKERQDSGRAGALGAFQDDDLLCHRRGDR